MGIGPSYQSQRRYGSTSYDPLELDRILQTDAQTAPIYSFRCQDPLTNHGLQWLVIELRLLRANLSILFSIMLCIQFSVCFHGVLVSLCVNYTGFWVACQPYYSSSFSASYSAIDSLIPNISSSAEGNSSCTCVLL